MFISYNTSVLRQHTAKLYEYFLVRYGVHKPHYLVIQQTS
jgi:hypothetical protein